MDLHAQAEGMQSTTHEEHAWPRFEPTDLQTEVERQHGAAICDLLHRWQEEGLTLWEMADRCGGVDASTVWKWKRRCGLNRGRGGQRRFGRGEFDGGDREGGCG